MGGKLGARRRYPSQRIESLGRRWIERAEVLLRNWVTWLSHVKEDSMRRRYCSTPVSAH